MSEPIVETNHATVLDPLTVVEPPEEVPLKTQAEALEKKSSALKPSPYDYRHYPTLHPVCNKILAMKWDENTRHRHLKKLAAAKPNVDNCAPKIYTHLQLSLKKVQMNEGH